MVCRIDWEIVELPVVVGVGVVVVERYSRREMSTKTLLLAVNQYQKRIWLAAWWHTEEIRCV